MTAVRLGSDLLIASGRLTNLTVGVVCNHASVDRGFAHVIDRMTAQQLRLGAIFGPQHGFRSDVQDNMVETPHAADARRRVPVYSLYSETREPTAEMLKGLDVLVIDSVYAAPCRRTELMRRWSRLAHRDHLPIVVLSGYLTDAHNSARGDGEVCLLKPCPPQQLTSSIAHLSMQVF